MLDTSFDTKTYDLLNSMNKNDMYDTLKYMYSRGYTNARESFFSTRIYKELEDTLNDYSPKTVHNFKMYKSLEDIKKKGKKFILKYTKGKNLIVSYSDYSLKSYIIDNYDMDIDEELYPELIDKINKYSSKCKIYNVPVNYEESNLRCSYIKLDYLYNYLDLSYYKMIHAPIGELHLEGKMDESLVSSYIHEMYHGLMYRNKGAIENVLLEEVPSIFMQKVYMNDLGLEDDTSRLTNLKYATNHIDKNNLGGIHAKTYLYSSAYAYHLFDLYKHGSEDVQEEIIDSLNKIIKGDCTLEDMLKKFSINAYDGVKVLEKELSYSH